MADEITAKEKATKSGFRCGRCTYPVTFPGTNKKTLCYTCGSVNIKPAGSPSGSWLPCVLPERFEWEDPSGVEGPDVPNIMIEGKTYVDYDKLVSLPMNARVIYIDAYGKEWNRMNWITEKGCDPAVTLKRMRQHMVPRPVVVIG